jgi:hypothetical protein
MKRVGLFLAGFASGWVVRSAVDSSRGLAVAGISALYGTAERLRRLVAIEREHLEDLVAEGRAKYESARGFQPPRAVDPVSPQGSAAQAATELPRRGRAA